MNPLLAFLLAVTMPDLTQLKQMEARFAPARDETFRLQRKVGIHVKQECLDNPLALGC